MDIGDLRGLGTLIVAIAFIGMSLWVSSSKRSPDFAEARMAPFADEQQTRGRAPEDEGSGDLTASAAPASSRLKPLPQTPCQLRRSGFSHEVFMAGDINASAAPASSRLKPLPQTPCQSRRSGFSREVVMAGDINASAAPASSRLKPLPHTPCQLRRSGFSREVVMAGDINASAAEAEQPVVRSTQP